MEVVEDARGQRAASIDEEQWVAVVQDTDGLLVNGGDPLYLCYWMRQSGLAGLLWVAA
jgi:dipeptidase E